MIKRRVVAICFIATLSVAGVCTATAYAAKPNSSKPSVKKNTPNPIPEMEMVSIPAGSFVMGNPDASARGDKNRWGSDGFPQHSVTLSAYSIGKYEVTRAQYRKFIEAGGYSNEAYWSKIGWRWKSGERRTEPKDWAAVKTAGDGSSFTQTDKHPVIGVTYHEAEAFCNWAGGHLPTEAQWERAACWNASTKHANVYPWGDTWDFEKCNNYEDHNPAAGGFHSNQTAPVGSYPEGASSSGCQDMAGNASEWCLDWYDEAYYSQSPTRDPQGPAYGNYRVLRGGENLLDAGIYFRCSSRYKCDPFSCQYFSGFRLAR